MVKPSEPGDPPRHRHAEDDAILAVERDTANLKGTLPRDYAGRIYDSACGAGSAGGMFVQST